MDLPDFNSMTNEQIIATSQRLLGAPSAAEIEAERIREQEKYEREQKMFAEWYASGTRWVEVGVFDKRIKRLYKRACPTCGTVFYTLNERRKYDDYYECSRYVHRENARNRRKENRKTVCAMCGKEFMPARAGARFCSAACKQKAYRERNKNQTDEIRHTQET